MRNTNNARIKPRLHERFFYRAGDAIFFKLSQRLRAMKITNVATLSQVMRTLKKSQKKKSQELKLSRQNHTDSWPRYARPSICYSCSDPRALATRQNLKKTMAPARAKNRSCSRSWQWNGTRIRERHLSLSLLNSANLVTYAILVNGHFDFLTIFLVVTGKYFCYFRMLYRRDKTYEFELNNFSTEVTCCEINNEKAKVMTTKQMQSSGYFK